MICWICQNEMIELESVKGDYFCNNCKGTYFREYNHYTFRDINDKIVSKPLWDEDD